MDFDLVQVGTTPWSDLFPKRDWLGVAQEIGELIGFAPNVHLSAKVSEQAGPFLNELGICVSAQSQSSCELFGPLCVLNETEVQLFLEERFEADLQHIWIHLWADPYASIPLDPLMETYETEKLKAIRTVVPQRHGSIVNFHLHYLIWQDKSGMLEDDERLELQLHNKNRLLDLAISVGWKACILNTHSQHIGEHWLYLSRE